MIFQRKREKVFRGKKKPFEAKVPEETGADKATSPAISSILQSASRKKLRTEPPPFIWFTSGVSEVLLSLRSPGEASSSVA